MADNVNITAGTGTTMGADEVVDGTLGTVKVAYGKIMDGTLDGTNKLQITAGNAAKVDGSAVTQPVSSATLATAANQATEIISLASIVTNTGTKADTFTTGTITAADAVVAAPTGNGTPLTGASTAGSIVALASPGGASAWVASITGTISGTYYFEISIDSTNGTNGTWINVNGRQTGLVSTTTVADYKTTVTGEFRGSPAGAKYFRVRNVGGAGLNTTVSIGMSTGTGPVFLYSSIPNGTNRIGTVGINDGTNAGTVKAASTAPVGTDTALVVTESPNSPASTSALQTTGNSSLSTISTNQTNGTQLSRLTDGTNQANVLKSDGTAAGQNAEIVAGTYLSVPFTTTTVQAVGTTDAGNYRQVSVQITSQGTSSTVAFQASNDNSTWVTTGLMNSTAVGTTAVNTSTTATGLFTGTVAGRYFRINVTGISAGTTAGTIVFSSIPTTPIQSSIGATQAGTWTVGSNSATGSAVPANTFYQGLQARTTAPTAATSGNLVGATANSMGMQMTTAGGLVTTAIAAATAGNTVIKNSTGVLCNVLVTATGAGSMSLFDNATTNTGTVIGILPASPTVGATYTFSMPAANGITVGGSATNPGVTISFV